MSCERDDINKTYASGSLEACTTGVLGRDDDTDTMDGGPAESIC